MSNIVCGKSIYDTVAAALKSCALTVTDTNLRALYPELTADAFTIDAGEKSKNVTTLCAILAEMHKRGIKRGDRIAAFGGGVVGDITGLAAALYMRGIEWVNVPTSLLAMVDSGIGGKTAVDFDGVKNLIGAFHEPTDIYVNAEFLKTLPEREWLCGDGELVKTCLLSEEAFVKLKGNLSQLFDKSIDGAFPLIECAIGIKNAVVTVDPHEKDVRKILNVGHTVGHALESVDGYKLSHGEYVLKGMMTEAAMCKELVDSEFYDGYIKLIGLFTRPPKTSANAVCNLASSDKKNTKGTISVMLPTAPGKVTEVKLAPDDFKSRYNAALKELKAE
ncbi:MAG: 3-dehydroquinate synthase [Clostridiales bacterium]|nr:3-dehydroquinate synthase [Clostridiales bacterium]